MRRTAPAVSLFACLTLFFSLSSPRLSRAQKLAAVGASAKAGGFDSLEQDVVREINLARTRPAEYASYLEQMRQYFAGNELRRPGRPALVTQEGVAALEDAIKFLRAAKPAAPLSASTGMCLGARELVKDQGATGATGHRGTDGSFCEQRTQRFGSWAGDIGEDLDYSNDTARERVLMLLIDDGVANRGHRLRLLSPDYKVVGVACGDHKLGGMCVITFASGFTAKPGSVRAQTGNGTGTTNAPAGVRRF
jgi:uncharacterized protein YkwD